MLATLMTTVLPPLFAAAVLAMLGLAMAQAPQRRPVRVRHTDSFPR